jgi:hypothetical protein
LDPHAIFCKQYFRKTPFREESFYEALPTLQHSIDLEASRTGEISRLSKLSELRDTDFVGSGASSLRHLYEVCSPHGFLAFDLTFGCDFPGEILIREVALFSMICSKCHNPMPERVASRIKNPVCFDCKKKRLKERYRLLRPPAVTRRSPLTKVLNE